MNRNRRGLDWNHRTPRSAPEHCIIYICYFTGGRSASRKTLPEVLDSGPQKNKTLYCYYHSHFCNKVSRLRGFGRSILLPRVTPTRGVEAISSWKPKELQRPCNGFPGRWQGFLQSPGTTGSPYKSCGPICLNKACSNPSLCFLLSDERSLLIPTYLTIFPTPPPFPPHLLTRLQNDIRLIPTPPLFVSYQHNMCSK